MCEMHCSEIRNGGAAALIVPPTTTFRLGRGTRIPHGIPSHSVPAQLGGIPSSEAGRDIWQRHMWLFMTNRA
jgi:hypothetical protein